jgi:hypothetical protein
MTHGQQKEQGEFLSSLRGNRRSLASPASSGAGSAGPNFGAVGLITPSHSGDLERFVMLIESIDKHVKRRGRHYVIVHDEDMALFKPYASEDRLILPASQFLPRSLVQVPFLRWRGRRYWWRYDAKPISGWHTQQMVKIQAAASLPEHRYCIIDSDMIFFREFDLAEVAAPNPIPLRFQPRDIDESHPRHVKWVQSAHRLLGLPAPALPADDFIDQIVIWDQATIRAMIARIASVTGRHFVAALCRDYEFSEYMIYGAYVANDSAELARHAQTTEGVCRVHWDSNPLSQADIFEMLATAPAHKVALCVQSFGQTPLSTIEAGVQAFRDVGEKTPATSAAA